MCHAEVISVKVHSSRPQERRDNLDTFGELATETLAQNSKGVELWFMPIRTEAEDDATRGYVVSHHCNLRQ